MDLAADMAGMKLAQYMTSDEYVAQSGQNLLAQSAGSEQAFFPSVTGLPEGLTAQQFEQQFQSTESVSYQAKVSEIEQRITMLPLYQAVQ